MKQSQTIQIKQHLEDGKSITPILVKDLGAVNGKKRGLFECQMCMTTFETDMWSGLNRNKSCLKCANAIRNYTHGNSKDRLYSIWIGMKRRCENKNHKHFSYYGGRGISVSSEWASNYNSFKQWALSNGYKNNLTIDRVDNDGNYEANNCHWVTRLTQSRNTRKLQKRNTSGYRGVCYDKSRNKWMASICVNNKQKYIGRYESAKSAAIAYDEYVSKNKLEHTTNFSSYEVA